MNRLFVLSKQVPIVVTCMLVSVLLGGARFHDKPLSPANTAMAYESRTLSDPGLKLFLEKNLNHPDTVWPKVTWDFSALTLAALYYHPDLDVARARWKMAKGGVDLASDRPGEIFQASPRYNANAPASKTPWYLEIASSFMFETAGKRKHRMEQAKHTAEVSRFNIAQTAWLTRSRLRASLVSVLAASERKQFLNAQLTAQQDMLQALEHRLALDEASQVEVMQARISQQQTQLTLSETNRVYGEGLAQTAQSIGIPVEALQAVKLSTEWLDVFPSMQNIERLRLREEALLGRADILALMEEYAASQAALQLAISRQYPDIRLGPGYLWNQGSRFWTMPLSLSFPNGIGNQGAIHDAKARRDEVAARYMALQATVISDVDRNYAAYQDALERVSAAKILLTEQHSRHQAVQKQFELGEADRLALRLSEVEFNAARITRTDALERAQLAVGLLEDAVQRPATAIHSSLPVSEFNPRLGE